MSKSDNFTPVYTDDPTKILIYYIRDVVRDRGLPVIYDRYESTTY